MEALNHKERRKGILKFFLFFSLLLILVTLVVYNLFSFKNQLNERQKDMLRRYNRFIKAEKLFIAKAVELDSLVANLPSGPAVDIDAQEVAKSNNFNSINANDSSFLKLSDKLMKVFNNYLKLKVKCNKEAGSSEELKNVIDKLEREIEKKSEEIKDLEHELKDCK